MSLSYNTKQLIGTLIFFSLIFISAGKWYYPQGILYVTVGIAMMTVGFTALSIDKDLQKERAKPAQNTKSWDKKILLLSFGATLAMYIVAGLDSGRFHATGELNRTIILLGVALTAIGQFLFLLAQKQNQFFSSTVRIQTQRNHTVFQGGLYTVVRHPAYFGMLIQTLGFPLIFTSFWSCIPVAVSIVLIIIRTTLEDATLQRELVGYKAYTQKTKYKLIPCVW